MSQIEKIFSKNLLLWKRVRLVLKKLHKQGFEAVLVGGSVRDALLKRPIKDFDIATSAHPEDVLKIFPRAKDKWKKYGVLFLPICKGEEPIQITTFRQEHSYQDGRRPHSLSYSSLEEDAKRRDFTVNALFYSIKDQRILDFHKGQKDLKNKIICTIGDPCKRFEEDKLRPLRAIRFAHQLEFKIEEQTQKAIILYAKKLLIVSRERIYNELNLILSSGRVGEALKLLDTYKCFHILFPSLESPKSYYSFWNKKFSFYKNLGFSWALLGLPYFIEGKIEGAEFLKFLKAPASVIKSSLFYMKGIKKLSDPSVSFLERLQIVEKQELALKELAFSLGKHQKEFKNIFKRFDSLKTSRGKLPKPLIKSSDLLKRSVTKKLFKTILNQVFEYQLKKGFKNKKEANQYLEKIIP